MAKSPQGAQKKKALKENEDCRSQVDRPESTTAFIYFSQGSPISPLRTVINRSPVHPKNYKIQYNLKIIKKEIYTLQYC